MEFRILGPLEARTGETSLPLGGTKQRAVLAQLLLRAGEVVSAERLVDGLWAEPPETATKAVQVHISQLRKALAPNVTIHTRARGYVLEVAAEDLDLSRSELLRAEGLDARAAGDLETAASRLHAALALWRGPPLAEFAHEPFAAIEAPRLEELRLTLLEERIEADLARRPPRRARVGARGARRRASAPRAGARPAACWRSTAPAARRPRSSRIARAGGCSWRSSGSSRARHCSGSSARSSSRIPSSSSQSPRRRRRSLPSRQSRRPRRRRRSSSRSRCERR